jgi:hypothetical protein
MSVALARPSITVNNDAIFIVANSALYTEGKGEQNVSVQSAGGSNVDIVISENVETNMSKVNFAMKNTADNIELIRSWKSNPGANAVAIQSGDFSRTIGQATLTNDYEVNLGSDTQIDLEFMGLAAV